MNLYIIKNSYIREYYSLLTSKKITINLAKELKVKPKKVLGFLTTPVGSSVKKDHLLAEKRGFLKKKRVLAPADGVLEKINEETGELIIKVSRRVELKSDGKRTTQRVAGFGKAEGELVNLGKELIPEVLKKEFSGKILIIKSLFSAQAVFKANALGVVGIILPRELISEEIEVKNKIWEKVGLAFLVKEGDYKKFVGKKVVMDGEKGEVRFVK